MGPDLTQAYFLPSAKKGPTHRYFLFFDPKGKNEKLGFFFWGGGTDLSIKTEILLTPDPSLLESQHEGNILVFSVTYVWRDGLAK